MTNLPKRKFFLYGDSGECDPEVYREIRDNSNFRAQVQEIWIRDVVNAAMETPDRLAGMKIIPGADARGGNRHYVSCP